MDTNEHEEGDKKTGNGNLDMIDMMNKILGRGEEGTREENSASGGTCGPNGHEEAGAGIFFFDMMNMI